MGDGGGALGMGCMCIGCLQSIYRFDTCVAIFKSYIRGGGVGFEDKGGMAPSNGCVCI